ncbi:peptidoglycan-binding domain-containing protein [Antribacter gilvus]|uniref:peptidoglycan-binding domain-containing protein n=1 Tax=Antribacter gilvus TaxID=2304675 RepID=UPI0013DEC981|nr:peptidoglycan-binding domain-containing protein [Antribacter gilvus]
MAGIVAAFVVGLLVGSPWDRAVANSNREPVVTAVVEERELGAESFSAQGTFSAGTTTALTAHTEGEAVVTVQTRKPGDVVSSGEVLAEVSGRPVIALALPFALYRDLTPGSEGTDVRAVQEALAGLGHFSGSPDGVYGPATAAAVDRLFDKVGYRPPSQGAEPTQAVEDAQDVLDEAREGLADAEAAPADDSSPVAAAARRGAIEDARKGVAEAQEALGRAREAAMTPLLRAEIVPLAGAPLVMTAAPVGTVLGEGAAFAEVRSGTPSVTVRVGVAGKESYPVGGPVRAHAITDSGLAAEGTVSVVSEFRHPDAETVPSISGHDVTIAFTGQVPFGEGATLVVEAGTVPPAVASGPAVPLLALRDGPEGLFVVLTDGTRVPVELVGQGNGFAVVRGIEAGATVVVSGDAGLSEG